MPETKRGARGQVRKVTTGQCIVAMVLSAGVLGTCLISTNVGSGSLSSGGQTHQGDLILDDGNVTTVTGRLDISGSLILREGATLILQDAEINIIQTGNYEHQIILGGPQDNPAGPGPRIEARNSTMGSGNWIRMELYGSSSVDFLNVTTAKLPTFAYNASAIKAHECDLTLISIWDEVKAEINHTRVRQTLSLGGNSDLTVAGSRVEGLVAWDLSNALIEESTIDLYLILHMSSSSCRIEGLVPGHAIFWEPSGNSSAVPGTGGMIPSLTLRHTDVASWGFHFHGDSHAEILGCQLRQAAAWDNAEMTIWDTPLYHQVLGAGDSRVYMENSSCNLLCAHEEACIRLIDSSFVDCEITDMAVVVSEKQLEVLVLDSEGTTVPQASVEARHQNQTTAETASTGEKGRATLLLWERTLTPAGTSISRPYLVYAGYGSHQDQAEVNLTDTQFVTFRLEGIAIPEASTVVTSLLAVLLATLVPGRRNRHPR